MPAKPKVHIYNKVLLPIGSKLNVIIGDTQNYGNERPVKCKLNHKQKSNITPNQTPLGTNIVRPSLNP
jgi:hypothetical protein